MDFIDDFRNSAYAGRLSGEIRGIVGRRKIAIMEVCGGQTHTIYKYRLRDLLPESLRLVSGPGCPVCVTPIGYIDKAISLALDHRAAVFTFGDLMRVPGTDCSLDIANARREKASGSAPPVSAVYAPMQAVEYARKNPKREVVFLGIGFETTIPSVGLAILHAKRDNLRNFSVLLSAKRVPPVLDALLSSGKVALDGFITPGHVTAIIGLKAYDDLCRRYSVPMMAGGFEPLDLLIAIRELSGLIIAGACDNGNAYGRVVRREGNLRAQEILESVFEPCDDELRGFGRIPMAGYRIRSVYAEFDAENRFTINTDSREPAGCICGDILVGLCEPADCPLFGKACTPGSPVGACMVSSEGSCNAAYMYRD